MMATRIQPWIIAFRLRTLPLALASIGMASLLAAGDQIFRWEVFLLAVLTTIFLQVLSNLANDYGDSVHGADHSEREGPARMVQSGAITTTAIKRAIYLFGVLCLISGMILLYVSFGWHWESILFFFALGMLSIVAAVTYTAGRKPYGYAGLGDISVILFFGLVGVLGTYYLYASGFRVLLLLPAMSCGLFSAAVLNVNNIRDIESDRKAGKKSIPVRIGRKKAVIYHQLLLLGGFLCAVVFTLLTFRAWWAFLFLLTMPLFIRNARAVRTSIRPAELDPFLRQLALATLLFVLLFGWGYVLSMS